MSIFHFTIRAALLLFPLFCAEPFLAQEKSPHACFEQPNGAKEAIRRLPESARYWLAEDAIYIITPQERCAFLHLNTDEEREQFIEQFWFRRSVDPISLDYDYKTEFYRRVVLANEKYGSKLLAGRNTDRARLYVIFGPPDSVDENSDPAAPHSMQTWHYHYIKGIGENVQIHFEYVTRYGDYVLQDADRDLVGQAESNPDLRIGPERPPKIRFKDLEALVVAREQDAFLLLNRYPYSSGHLMAAPLRHIGAYGALTDEEALQIHRLAVRAIAALEAEYRAQGVNLGWNLGRAAGAGVVDHVHLHVVPRWVGDTNFMPVLADAKAIPEALAATAERLRARL